MLAPLVAIVAGLVVLVWSADRFVFGAASLATHFSVSPLLIGMVIIGFGTSTPELTVSASAALGGNGGLALGNAYGSNIANIALILGLVALVRPITVQSSVVRMEIPILCGITALAILLIVDESLSRLDAGIQIGVFVGVMIWSVRQARKAPTDVLAAQVDSMPEVHLPSVGRCVFWVAVGLVLLVASSQVLVWGAVQIAQGLGVSDLIIGLTIVAIGTSLPELASSLAAARRGNSDLALGNIIGSNLFNTLAVVGVAGLIHPMSVSTDILHRDMPVLAGVTILLLVVCYRPRGAGTITRAEGVFLLACYGGYSVWLAQ